MALLQNAKAQADAKSDSDKEPEKKPKKKKHPASVQNAQQDEGPAEEAGQGQDDSDAGEQPVAGDGGADSDGDAADGAGQGGQQGQPEEGAQQNGAQDATPVPNPQAPGAGVEEGGEDTPDNEDEATGGAPDQNAPTPSGAPGGMGGPGAASLQQVPMTPALKEEYQALDKALLQVLYQQGGAEHIVPSLFAQGPHKIKGVVSASVVLAREIFLKVKAPPQLTLPFARDVTAHVLQIGEQVKGIQYSDQEFTAIFTAVYEGMLRAFGVKKEQVQHMKHLIPKSAVQQHMQAYGKAVNDSQAAAQANGAQQHAADVPPQGPAAQAAGPQGPQGAGGNGMLSQAAAQQEQGGGEEEGEGAQPASEEQGEPANG